MAALLLTASLTACGAGIGKVTDMQIRESELTKEEQRILELFGISDIGHIFDYQINLSLIHIWRKGHIDVPAQYL